MNHSFVIRYELNVPLAIAVAIYLDCEHYVYLHKGLSNDIRIVEKGNDYFKCLQVWKIFGIKFGQAYTCSYVPPSTFINSDVKPHPVWIPSIHHFVHSKTTLRYYETDRKTTLSELTVELEMPFWLFPFRRWIEQTIEKVKVLKDLEDVALCDRRARLFGRSSNQVYLKKNQFLLHKDDYVKYFGENSEFYGKISDEMRTTRWTNIKDLDRGYVRNFLEKKYIKYTNSPNSPEKLR